MNFKDNLSKLKPVIIILLLFSVVFVLRAEAYNISGVPDESKDFYKDDTGLPYFSEMDSYYNYRLTENFIENGIIGDTTKNGEAWDLHSYYPPGREVAYPPLIIYLTAAFYYLANIFATVPLTVVAFWTGSLIASLCVIPAYFLVRKISNDYGGIVAGILVATAPTYFSHTFAGFFDTDMFTILLPLLVIWFLVESILAPNLKKQVIFGVLSALSLLLFSLAWVGYIFYLVLVVIFVIAYFLISRYIIKINQKAISEYPDKLKWFLDQKELVSLATLLIVGVFMVGIFNGFSSIINSLLELAGATQIQTLVQSTAYPNIYVSVSELQVPSFITLAGGVGGVLLPNQASMVGGVGGLLVFLCGIGGLVTLILKMRMNSSSRSAKKSKKKLPKSKRKNRYSENKEEVPVKKDTVALSPQQVLKIKRESLLYLVLLSIWVLMTAYASTKGFRFVAEFSVPIALSAGIFVGYAVEYIRDNLTSSSTLALVAFIAGALIAFPLGLNAIIILVIGLILGGVVYLVKKPNLRATIVMILVLLAVISAPIAGAYVIASSVVPGTDDGMFNSMEWINNNTSENTVITSWWDFGHLFAAVAERPVTFDGGSQNSPRAYWVGKAMLTSNETLSAGIFKMLATSGDDAYLTLDNYTNDSGKSAEILTQTLGVDRESALEIMTTEYNLTVEQSRDVLQYSHPENPSPSVFVASADMLGKSGWWAYFGSWDFNKNEGTRSSYFPAMATSQPQQVNNTTVIQTLNTMAGDTMVGVIVQESADEVNATIAVGENETFQAINPHKLIIIQGNQILKNEIVDSESELSLVVIGEKGSYTTIIMDKALEDSMFTKLFLMGGFNQTSFEFIHQEPGVVLWRPV